MTDLAIFDIDGTLTTFHEEELECFDQTVNKQFGVSEFNRDWGSYKNVTYTGFVLEIAEEHLGKTLSVSDLQLFEEEFLNRYGPIVGSQMSTKKEIKGANNMLSHLRGLDGIQLAIATGNWRRLAELKLAGAGINIDGMPMSTCDDAQSREEIMQFACQMAAALNGGQPFDMITYVGDGEWDAKASQNLGYDFIGITTNVSKELFERYGAKATFNDYSDLNAFVEALLQHQ